MIGSLTAGLGALGAAGSIAGGLIGQAGANQAGNMANNAANQAYAGMQHQQDMNRADAAPWTATGSKAVQQIGALLGYGGLSGTGAEGSTLGYGNDYNPAMQTAALNQIKALAGASGATLPVYKPLNDMTTVSENFQADPSYAFRLGEGNKALDRSAASKGMLLSGAQAKALTGYNQDMASQEYGNWFNRLSGQKAFNQGVNAQNFGQQQTLYGDQYGQYNDALNRLFATAGMGQQSMSNTAGVNSGLQTSGGNALLQGGIQAGNDYASGANALASGVGRGINNVLAGAYMFGGGLGGGGGASSYDAAKTAYSGR